MIDDRTLAEAFQKAKAADRMRVPPMRTILARAEYAREMQKRRRFTAGVSLASALIGAVTLGLVTLAPGAFPLPMSPSITPLLVLGLVATLWAINPSESYPRSA